ncbi:MAG: hypothetical protein OXC38_07190 [Gammaproteobacteria bacterium]|nr:hypothetical protein [Gammaproteobacteria bacterium]
MDRTHVKPSIDEEGSNFLSPLVEETKLTSENRRRRKAYDEKSVHPVDVPEETEKGWDVQRHGKRSTRLKRLKSHDKLLEDRVWCLFYLMGYRVLNDTNFKISFLRADGSRGKKQVDVYAEDQETVLVIECKSSVMSHK